MKIESNISAKQMDTTQFKSKDCFCSKDKSIESSIKKLVKEFEGSDKKESNLVDRLIKMLKKHGSKTERYNKKSDELSTNEASSNEANNTEATQNTETIEPANEQAICQSEVKIKEPGKESYQSVIRDLVQPGDDGKLGEKEIQVGLIKFALYQYDQNTLNEFNQYYDEDQNLEHALSQIVNQGFIPQEDIDWVKSYTASAAETNRGLGSDKRVDVELSDNTRYDYNDIINWSEANLAHIIHENVIV